MNGLRRIPIRHQSTREQVRRLQKRCAEITQSTDVEINRVGDRVLASCLNDPNPGFSTLHLYAAGLDRAEEMKISWSQAMTEILDEFGVEKNLTFDPATYAKSMMERTDATSTTKVQRVETSSRLRGLLRSLIPRSLRSSNEKGQRADEYQRARDAYGQQATGQGRNPKSKDPRSTRPL